MRFYTKENLKIKGFFNLCKWCGHFTLNLGKLSYCPGTEDNRHKDLFITCKSFRVVGCNRKEYVLR